MGPASRDGGSGRKLSQERLTVCQGLRGFAARPESFRGWRSPADRGRANSTTVFSGRRPCGYDRRKRASRFTRFGQTSLMTLLGIFRPVSPLRLAGSAPPVRCRRRKSDGRPAPMDAFRKKKSKISLRQIAQFWFSRHSTERRSLQIYA